MYNKTHLYDLSFVSPKEGTPQFVFTLEEKYLDELNRRLRRLVEHTNVKVYLEKDVPFAFPASDLFGNFEFFGFDKCGSVSVEEGQIRLHINLARGAKGYLLRCATLTTHLLTQVLSAPFEEKIMQLNRLQELDLLTLCEHDMHGHSISGYVSGDVVLWLRVQGKLVPKGEDYASVHEEIIAAMREAWVAVSLAGERKWAEHCRGMITAEGRFMLTCFGNACDVAIYPDTLAESSPHSVRFSCHNLDTATQQVTLLAGLAKLCELARRES